MSEFKTLYLGALLMAMGVVGYIAVLAYILSDNGEQNGQLQASPLQKNRR
jgi:hypothetical protein